MVYNLSLKYVSGRKTLWRQGGEESVLPRNSCGSCGPAVLSLGCRSQGQWSAAPSHRRSWGQAPGHTVASCDPILCSHPGSWWQLQFSPASALLPHSPVFSCPAGPDPVPMALSSYPRVLSGPCSLHWAWSCLWSKNILTCCWAEEIAQSGQVPQVLPNSSAGFNAKSPVWG